MFAILSIDTVSASEFEVLSKVFLVAYCCLLTVHRTAFQYNNSNKVPVKRNFLFFVVVNVSYIIIINIFISQNRLTRKILLQYYIREP